MKIGIITRRSLDDKKIWSGTVYNLSKIVMKSYEVQSIVIKDFFINKALRKMINKLFHKNKKTMLTSFLDRIILKNKIKRAMREGIKLFFVMANSDLIASGGIPKGCKLIYLSDATYHAMVNYYYFDNVHDQKIGNQAEQKSINRADAIIYSSEWAKEDAINYYNALEEKVTIIPFPSYIEDYYEKKENLNDKKTIHLLFVGVEWERKGTDLAIGCVDYLNKSQNDITFDLTIIGLDKPENKYYENYIVFKGRLYKDNPKEYNQLITYYKNSDIFILPTKAECSAVVFSEACMYGLPIFTHETGGIGTYVKDKYNGIKLPLGSTGRNFGEKIFEMIKEQKLQEYSDNARYYYEEKLNTDSWKNKFEKVVKNTLDR